MYIAKRKKKPGKVMSESDFMTFSKGKITEILRPVCVEIQGWGPRVE